MASKVVKDKYITDDFTLPEIEGFFKIFSRFNANPDWVGEYDLPLSGGKKYMMLLIASMFKRKTLKITENGSPIDYMIEPMLTELHTKGYTTNKSCDGHFNFPPYVDILGVVELPQEDSIEITKCNNKAGDIFTRIKVPIDTKATKKPEHFRSLTNLMEYIERLPKNR